MSRPRLPPHIGCDSGRQRIIGDLFQSIAEEGIAKNARQFFQREHILRNRAELGAADRRCAVKVFVAAEDAVGLTVVFHQIFDAEARCQAMPGFAGLRVENAARLHAHRVVGGVRHHSAIPLRQRQNMSNAVVRLQIRPV